METTFQDRLKKMLEDAGNGRPSTFTMVIILMAEVQLKDLSASAQPGDQKAAAAKLPQLFDLTKKLAGHADTALEYGAQVVRSGSTAYSTTRDGHLRQYNAVLDQLLPLMAELRKLAGLPF